MAADLGGLLRVDDVVRDGRRSERYACVAYTPVGSVMRVLYTTRRLCSSEGWLSTLIEFVALAESRQLACCASYDPRSGRCRKLTYGAERRNSFSSLPLVGIDRSWPASLANAL